MQLVEREDVLSSPNKLLLQLATIGQVIECYFTRSRDENDLREGLALVEEWRRYFLITLGDQFDAKQFDKYAANLHRHFNALSPASRPLFECPYEKAWFCKSLQVEDVLLHSSAIASTAASASDFDTLRVALPPVKRYLRALIEMREERLKDFIRTTGNIANIVRVVPDFLSCSETNFLVSQMHQASLQVDMHFAFDSALVIWLHRHVLHSGIASDLSSVVPLMGALKRKAKRANLYNEFRQIKYAGRIYIN